MTTASLDLVQKSMTALTSTVAGNEFATLLNKGSAAALGTHIVAKVIVATSTSQTTDFGSLRVGDHAIHFHVSAGTTKFRTVTAAGNLGYAAVIGDIYVILRAIGKPAASAVLFP